jgi:hypothetical protein
LRLGQGLRRSRLQPPERGRSPISPACNIRRTSVAFMSHRTSYSIRKAVNLGLIPDSALNQSSVALSIMAEVLSRAELHEWLQPELKSVTLRSFSDTVCQLAQDHSSSYYCHASFRYTTLKPNPSVQCTRELSVTTEQRAI